MEFVLHSPYSASQVAPPSTEVRKGLDALPVFRPVALKILKLLDSEESEVQRMAQLLRADPALSAQVLAVANSAFYGNSHHIDNLGRAILVLGFQRTRALTLTVALKSFLRHRVNAQVMQRCWRHSLAAGLLAEELVPHYQTGKDEAYTAALMHDIGRLGLLMAWGDIYSPLLESPYETLADCLEAERRHLQIDHCQAGLWLTQRWGFPSEYSRVAGCHHDGAPGTHRDLVSLTHAACLLADALGFPAVLWTNSPSAAEVLAAVPAGPHAFDWEALQGHISKQIAEIEAA